MPRLNQRGVIHLLVPFILLIGIIAGVYLIKTGNLKLFSKATNPPIVFKNLQGQVITTTTSPTVKIELTSTLGGPKPSPTVSGPINTYTVSYRFAENPTDLNNASSSAYLTEPTVLDYTFKDQTPGLKSIFVEFLASNGTTGRRTAQIELVAPALFSNLSANFAQNQATFSFNYTGKTTWFKIDASIMKNMSRDVYVDFAGGDKSPVTENNPKKWDKYSCGRTLYWRVYSMDRKEKSEIQATKINCISPSPTPVAGTFSNLSATMVKNQATFNFTYSGPRSTLFRVDVSTIKDMSGDVYVDFAGGSKSPVVMNYPTKWDKYNCGRTLYWKVKAYNNQIISPIQTSTVTCPTPKPTPTPIPSPTPVTYKVSATSVDITMSAGSSATVFQIFSRKGYGVGGKTYPVASTQKIRFDTTGAKNQNDPDYYISDGIIRLNDDLALGEYTGNCIITDYLSKEIFSIPIKIKVTPPVKRVFVTSTTYNGNLGGLSGADAKCQERANIASLGGTWKAWLSDTNTSAASRLTHNTGPYKLLNNAQVANNWADLIDGYMVWYINADETGKEIKPQQYMTYRAWTGSRENGEKIGDMGSYCQNWTTSVAYDGQRAYSGTSGEIFSYSRWSWSPYGSNPCSDPNRLYCFEQ